MGNDRSLLGSDTSIDEHMALLDGTLSSLARRVQKRRWGTLVPLLPALCVLCFLLVLPMLLLLDYSFGGVGLDLSYYKKALFTPVYQEIILRTFRIAFVVTAVNLAIGYPLAYAAARGRIIGRIIVLTTLAPLTIDLIIRSFGWQLLLGQNGIIFSTLTSLGIVKGSNTPQILYTELAIVIGLSHIMLPFMVFPIMNSIHTIPISLEEAARDLGANRLTVFIRVLVPLSVPGIAAGVLITFVGALGAYVTPVILGGNNKVISVVIVNSLTSSGDWEFASALSIVLLLLGLSALLVYQKILSISDHMGGYKIE